MRIPTTDPLAVSVRAAITKGDVAALEALLREHEGLGRAVILSGDQERSLLHVATDWPGHFPNGADTVRTLVAHGADPNAQFVGPHRERPLHWAASSDDVPVLDALLDFGADIEADGSVIDGGSALADAVAFGQWNAARRLVERGARTTLWQAAALGLVDRLGLQGATPDELTNAFWCACHGGQRETAELLLARGANRNWIGYDGLTPLDAALRAKADALVEWLRTNGGKPAAEL